VLSRTDWFWWGHISLCAFKPGGFRSSYVLSTNLKFSRLVWMCSSLWYIAIDLGTTPLHLTQSLLLKTAGLGTLPTFSLRFDNSWFKDPRASFCYLYTVFNISALWDGYRYLNTLPWWFWWLAGSTLVAWCDLLPFRLGEDAVASRVEVSGIMGY